jgi:hypothetical protein
MYVLQALGQAFGNLTTRSVLSFQLLLSALAKNSELDVKRSRCVYSRWADGPTRRVTGSESILALLVES